MGIEAIVLEAEQGVWVRHEKDALWGLAPGEVYENGCDHLKALVVVVSDCVDDSTIRLVLGEKKINIERYDPSSHSVPFCLYSGTRYNYTGPVVDVRNGPRNFCTEVLEKEGPSEPYKPTRFVRLSPGRIYSRRKFVGH